MSEVAIRVENLGKQYYIGGSQKRFNRFSEKLVDSIVSPLNRAYKILRGQAGGATDMETAFWALKHVDFEINSGEVVGVIGRNGAGKSTLLKILSRITEPSEGFAEIYGRVGSLLEVGTGFHPELTGRENVFLNGAILGMKKSEIQRKFDEIVAFAEIEQFIDTPVKQYSSGMYVRLAFSVAAHLETEILLIDEVLAVGDMAFQKKCLGKMEDVADEGRTVLFVSHNLGLVQSLCQRGIYICEGTVHVDDRVNVAAESYLRTLERTQEQALSERHDRQGAGKVRLVGVDICGDDPESPVLRTGSKARFIFHLTGLLADIACVFILFDQFGHPISVLKSNALGPEDISAPDIGAKFICEMDCLLLLAGRYRIDVMLRGGGERQDYVEAAAVFDVESGHVNGRLVTRPPKNRTSIVLPHRWTLPLEF